MVTSTPRSFHNALRKMQQLDAFQKHQIQDEVRLSERLSPIPNFSFRIRTQRFFLLHFSTDTAHCTMRHYKLLYYACSVSTWKTVMHAKLNRFTAKTYTRDREKMHAIL